MSMAQSWMLAAKQNDRGGGGQHLERGKPVEPMPAPVILQKSPAMKLNVAVVLKMSRSLTETVGHKFRLGAVHTAQQK